jgi:hypothetical protein
MPRVGNFCPVSFDGGRKIIVLSPPCNLCRNVDYILEILCDAPDLSRLQCYGSENLKSLSRLPRGGPYRRYHENEKQNSSGSGARNEIAFKWLWGAGVRGG